MNCGYCIVPCRVTKEGGNTLCLKKHENQSIVKPRLLPRFAALTRRATALERGLLFDKNTHARQHSAACNETKF